MSQDGDGEIDYNELARMILCDDIMELLALVPDRSLKSKAQAAANAPIGGRGCTVKELQDAQKAIKEKLMIKYGSVGKALRTIDGGPQNKGTSDGMLSREEIINMMHKHQLIKHTDYHTGAIVGDITMAVADTLIDFVDDDGDGNINYQEFTKVLTAEDIMHIPAPKSVNANQLWGDGR